MKCIYCGEDTQYKDRKQSSKCVRCGRAFAFEPKQGDRLTDAAFNAAIERVSSHGTVRWTEAHLRHELLRRAGGGAALVVLFIVAGGLATLGCLLWAFSGRIGFPFLFVALFLGLVGLTLWKQHTAPPREFDSLWRRWQQAHPNPVGLIVRRREPKHALSAPPLPSDISAYSFDRAVVCDRSETVDLLLANNFHFENNCAVLSYDGYPERAFATVRAMLKNNPKLTVFTLHDATITGCLLPERVATEPDWFPGMRVIDVGMRPHQARKLSKHFGPPGSFIGSTPGITPEERSWLSAHSCELAALPPEQTIKRLFRSMSLHGEQSVASSSSVTRSTSGAYYIDTGSLASNATTSDGGGDSFG